MLRFFSPTKFVEEMNMKIRNIEAAALFFEPEEVWVSPYNSICIKPIAMAIHVKNSNTFTFSHENLLNMFGGNQIVISVSETNHRKKPEGSQLHYLEINFVQMKWHDHSYYPCEIYPSYNEEINEDILNQKIDPNVIQHSAAFNYNTLSEVDFKK